MGSLAVVSGGEEDPSLVTELTVTLDSVSDLQVEGQVLIVSVNGESGGEGPFD